MKVIILSNQARSMAIFWRALIAAMRKRNMLIVCCVPPGDEVSDSELKSMGARVVHYSLDRKGLNPLRDARTFFELKNIFIKEKPDILFSATIKPVIYGCMAARRADVPRFFATITGLGYAFEADTPLKKIINRVSRILYRASLKTAHGVFFQNQDDAGLFRESGILSPDANILFAAGTGVDTDWFAPRPFPQLPPAGPVVFLLVARLLQAKGIEEFIEAARKLKKNYPLARFQILGPQEHGPGRLDMEIIRSASAEGIVEYLGEARDVRPFVANCHVAVLPSWREGTPTSLLEAMSMGRPLVASDAPGCREVVANGQNGWLAQCRNAPSLANMMEKFLLDNSSIAVMGAKSRQIALEKFDAEKVAEGILNDMLKTFPSAGGK